MIKQLQQINNKEKNQDDQKQSATKNIILINNIHTGFIYFLFVQGYK